MLLTYIFVFQLAFMLFEGILMYSPQSSFIGSAARSTKVMGHWIMIVTAITTTLSGFYVIYHNKERNESPHFTSWHGIVGLITIITVCGVGPFGGLAAKYPQYLAPMLRPADVKMYHATGGLFAVSLFSATLILAFYTTWFTTAVTGTTWYACVVCVIAMLLIITNQVTTAYIRRTKVK